MHTFNLFRLFDPILFHSLSLFIYCFENGNTTICFFSLAYAIFFSIVYFSFLNICCFNFHSTKMNGIKNHVVYYSFYSYVCYYISIFYRNFSICFEYCMCVYYVWYEIGFFVAFRAKNEKNPDSNRYEIEYCYLDLCSMLNVYNLN